MQIHVQIDRPPKKREKKNSKEGREGERDKEVGVGVEVVKSVCYKYTGTRDQCKCNYYYIIINQYGSTRPEWEWEECY